MTEQPGHLLLGDRVKKVNPRQPHGIRLSHEPCLLLTSSHKNKVHLVMFFKDFCRFKHGGQIIGQSMCTGVEHHKVVFDPQLSPQIRSGFLQLEGFAIDTIGHDLNPLCATCVYMLNEAR